VSLKINAVSTKLFNLGNIFIGFLNAWKVKELFAKRQIALCCLLVDNSAGKELSCWNKK